VNLIDLLKKRTVPKVVDPGSDSVTGTMGARNENIPSAIKAQQDFKDTPIPTIVSDLKQQVINAQAEVQKAIVDIINTNATDTIFQTYSKLVQSSSFNPAVLLTDKAAKPNNKVNTSAIIEAERNVYTNLTDPRAPFLNDLYGVQSVLGSFQYTLKSVWDNILKSNEYPDDRLTRLSLYRDQETVAQLSNYATRVRGNTMDPIESAFVTGLVNSITQDLQKNSSQYSKSVEESISTLQGIQTYLQASLIIQNGQWETFFNIIKHSYTNILNQVAQKIMSSQNYATSTMLNNKIFTFTDRIEHVLGMNGMIVAPVLQEFKNQIDHAIFFEVSKIEDDMISKERTDLQTQMMRDLALTNSQKSSHTKQYIHAIDAAIVQLNSMKYQTTLGDTSSLFNTIGGAISSYRSKTRVTPGKPLTQPFNIDGSDYAAL